MKVCSLKRTLCSLLLAVLLPCPVLAEVGGQAGVGAYTGPIGMTGNRGNGSDQMNNVCKDGVCPVTAFGAKCDGTTDDTAAFASAIAAATGQANYMITVPAGETCLASQINLSTAGLTLSGGAGNPSLQGSLGQLGKIIITGNGGGVCSAGVNGGIRVTQFSTSIQNLQITFNNNASQPDCLINASRASGQTGNLHFSNLWLGGEANITKSANNPIAIKTIGPVEFYLDRINTQNLAGSSPATTPFRQQFTGNGSPAGTTVYIENSVFNPNSKDYVNGVYNDELPMVDFSQLSVSTIRNTVMETGPFYVKSVVASNGGNSNVIESSYLGDAMSPYSPFCGTWLPNDATYGALGSCVVPSITTTGNGSSGTVNVTGMASQTTLYPGQRLNLQACGAASADLLTSVASIVSGTAVNTANSMSCSTVGMNMSWPVTPYAGLMYVATTGGTTGATQPTWPTTIGQTVSDGTVTWTAYPGYGVLIGSGAASIVNTKTNGPAWAIGIIHDAVNNYGYSANISGGHVVGSIGGVWAFGARGLNIAGVGAYGGGPFLEADANGTQHVQDISVSGSWNFAVPFASNIVSVDPLPSGGLVSMGLYPVTGPSANDWFSCSYIASNYGCSTTKTRYNGFTFSTIGSWLQNNGDIGFCSDCTIANPCAGAGTGAIAKRLNGVNVCN